MGNLKAACYCMTRNIYPQAIPSMKSLLTHSDVDKIYLVTEDDDIGYDVPDCVEIRNVSGQTWFKPDGPNYHSGWTYMVMMRMALCHLFPEWDRMLSLDLDTIVRHDISHLWDVPIQNHYCAGVIEPGKSRDGNPYINMGVVVWNLKKMRDGKADEVIQKLNTNWYRLNEQDCFNACHEGKVYRLAAEYNANWCTDLNRGIRIRHYAAEPGWYENSPEVKEYIQKPWEECIERGETLP